MTVSYNRGNWGDTSSTIPIVTYPVGGFADKFSPIVTNRWVLVFEDLDTAISSRGIQVESNSNETKTVGERNIATLVQDVTFGTYGLTTKNINVSSDFSIKLPQGEAVPDLDVTFIENGIVQEGENGAYILEPPVISMIKNWRNKVKNYETRVYNPPSTYKKEAKLYIADSRWSAPANNLLQYTTNIPVYIHFRGIFPVTVSTMNLTYNNSKPLVYRVRFSCDTAAFANM